MEGQTSTNNPRHPIDLVTSLKAPVLGLYGGADTGIPVTSVNNMKEALALAATKGNKAAKASEFVLYPDAPHAFHADYRSSFRAAPAADGWNRALAWFKQNV
jgi:carboxymethylenebutenolidase